MIDMQKIITYLSELEKNNNREWYHAQKEQRQRAVIEFEALIKELNVRIGEFESSIRIYNPSELTFKLVRDTRFSKDKSPYNPTFRAHIASKGKLPIPVGYYISIRPSNQTFLGGGLFTDMFKNATAMIRDYIDVNGEEFGSVISDKSFSADFSVAGTRLKNVPKGYNSNHPMAEYLKNKSWYLEYKVSDEMLIKGDSFMNTAVEKFKLMKPFNDFLNKALLEFKMPQRR